MQKDCELYSKKFNMCSIRAIAHSNHELSEAAVSIAKKLEKMRED